MKTIDPSLLNIVPAGKYYDAEVPDTLDLAERAELTIHGILNSFDPALKTIFMLIFFRSNNPFFQHWSSADGVQDAKVNESLPMMRSMCGSIWGEREERDYRSELLSRIDGGLYWDRYSPLRPWRNIYSSNIKVYGTGHDEDFSSVFGVARLIRALKAWEGVNRSETADLCASLIRGLRRIAIDQDDFSYYPHRGGWADGFNYPTSGWLDTTEADRDREGPV